jgi:hypothetical protein
VRDFLDVEKNAKAVCTVVGFLGGGIIGFRLGRASGIGGANFWGGWLTDLSAPSGAVFCALIGWVAGYLIYLL